MIDTLIPMRQFVLETTEQSDGNSDALCAIIYEYAQFLSLPLKLGYFVACNENDVPLIEPKYPWKDSIMDEGVHKRHKEKLIEWQAAQSRVLFEGFENIDVRGGYPQVKNTHIDFTFDQYGCFLNMYDACDGQRINSIDRITQLNLPKQYLTLSPQCFSITS